MVTEEIPEGIEVTLDNFSDSDTLWHIMRNDERLTGFNNRQWLILEHLRDSEGSAAILEIARGMMRIEEARDCLEKMKDVVIVRDGRVTYKLPEDTLPEECLEIYDLINSDPMEHSDIKNSTGMGYGRIKKALDILTSQDMACCEGGRYMSKRYLEEGPSE